EELKTRGEAHAASGSRDEDLAVFERLSQSLERWALKLRQLVEQQHAAVREARLAGPQPRPAAHDRGGRGAVVRRSKRRVADQWMLRVDQAGDGVDARHLQRRVLLERRQDA